MKAHVVGIAGSGKTTFAQALAHDFAVPPIDLDLVVYDSDGRERSEREILAQLAEVRGRPGWVVEGAYRATWLSPFLEDADVIVWLDVPFPACALRMIRRHIRAEVSGNNLHRGWRKLASFLNYTRRTSGLQRAETAALLLPFAAKVRRCRSGAESRELRARLRDRTPTSR